MGRPLVTTRVGCPPVWESTVLMMYRLFMGTVSLVLGGCTTVDFHTVACIDVDYPKLVRITPTRDDFWKGDTELTSWFYNLPYKLVHWIWEIWNFCTEGVVSCYAGNR